MLRIIIVSAATLTLSACIVVPVDDGRPGYRNSSDRQSYRFESPRDREDRLDDRAERREHRWHHDGDRDP